MVEKIQKGAELRMFFILREHFLDITQREGRV
jgi:hypothetical protein